MPATSGTGFDRGVYEVCVCAFGYVPRAGRDRATYL